MALTQQQQDLIDCLKLSGIGKEDITAIVLPLAKDEAKMDEMLVYLIENLQNEKKVTADEAMERMYRITGMIKD